MNKLAIENGTISPSVMPLDVLLVDNLDEIIRKRIKAILSRDGEFGVVSEAENGVAALQFIKQHKPGLVLMGIGEPGTANEITSAANEITSNVFADIGPPGLNGVDTTADTTAETTAEILRHHPECRVVILSMREDECSVVSAVRSGARGFVLRTVSDNELLEALRVVADGGAYLSPQVADRLLARIQKGDLESKQDSALAREIEVLRLMDDKTSKEIAALLRNYRKTKA